MPATPVAHHHLPSLPRDEEGPVFNEPWEAQAFALAVRLSETGRFSWREWTTALSQEIQAALGGSRLPDGTGSPESRSASGT